MNTHPITAYRQANELTMTAFAAVVGVKKATVSRWESGHRKVDPARALEIEKLTGGKLNRTALRPDLYGGMHVTTKTTRLSTGKFQRG